jgi:hypothetical protein
MVAAHKADILHRDLKPENIFLKRTITGSWTVKVLDFGLAKLSQTPSRQTMDGKGNVFGSIYYMAPEQFRREPLDVRTDIYALGCVFYQALTQRFPFEGENMAGTMDAHLNHLVKSVELRRKDTPPAVAAWLNRMIALDRNDRPASAMMARREFDEALEGKAPTPKSATPAIVARPSSTPAPPPAPVARPPMATTSTRAPSYASTASGGTAVAAPPAPPRATPTQRSAPMPARATSGVVTVNPRVLSTAAVTRPAAEKPAWKKHQNLIFAAVPVLLAGGFFLFLSQRSDEGKTAAGVKTEATPKSVAPAAPASPPKPAGEPLPTALSLSLPFEDKLTWRFRAGVEIWNQGDNGQQARKTAYKNHRIHSWRNLSPSLKEVYMRPYGNPADNAPSVTVGDVNGVGTESARLSFSGNQGMRHQLDSSAGLKAPGNGVTGSKGVTLAAVFRANASKKDKSIRPVLVGSSFSKDTISIHHSHIAGQYWVRVQHGNDLVLPLVRPKQFEAKGSPWQWVVAVAVWNSAEGKIRFSVRSPDGQVVKSDEVTIPKGIPMMDQFTVGFYPLPSDTKLDSKEKFDGDIAEVAVYRDALDAAGQEKLMNALWDCYFPKR